MMDLLLQTLLICCLNDGSCGALPLLYNAKLWATVLPFHSDMVVVVSILMINAMCYHHKESRESQILLYSY